MSFFDSADAASSHHETPLHNNSNDGSSVTDLKIDEIPDGLDELKAADLQPSSLIVPARSSAEEAGASVEVAAETTATQHDAVSAEASGPQGLFTASEGQPQDTETTIVPQPIIILRDEQQQDTAASLGHVEQTNQQTDALEVEHTAEEALAVPCEPEEQLERRAAADDHSDSKRSAGDCRVARPVRMAPQGLVTVLLNHVTREGILLLNERRYAERCARQLQLGGNVIKKDVRVTLRDRLSMVKDALNDSPALFWRPPPALPPKRAPSAQSPIKSATDSKKAAARALTAAQKAELQKKLGHSGNIFREESSSSSSSDETSSSSASSSSEDDDRRRKKQPTGKKNAKTTQLSQSKSKKDGSSTTTKRADVKKSSKKRKIEDEEAENSGEEMNPTDEDVVGVHVTKEVVTYEEQLPILRELLPLRLNARYSDTQIRNALEHHQKHDKIVSIWVCEEGNSVDVDLDEVQVWHGVLSSQKRKSWTINYNVMVPSLKSVSGLNGSTWVSHYPKVMTDNRGAAVEYESYLPPADAVVTILGLYQIITPEPRKVVRKEVVEVKVPRSKLTNPLAHPAMSASAPTASSSTSLENPSFGAQRTAKRPREEEDEEDSDLTQLKAQMPPSLAAVSEPQLATDDAVTPPPPPADSTGTVRESSPPRSAVTEETEETNGALNEDPITTSMMDGVDTTNDMPQVAEEELSSELPLEDAEELDEKVAVNGSPTAELAFDGIVPSDIPESTRCAEVEDEVVASDPFLAEEREEGSPSAEAEKEATIDEAGGDEPLAMDDDPTLDIVSPQAAEESPLAIVDDEAA